MLIGNQFRFAIEYEVSWITDNATYGNILFWANGESLGDWDDVAMINGCVHWLDKFAAKSVIRYHPVLEGMSKEDIVRHLHDSFNAFSPNEPTQVSKIFDYGQAIPNTVFDISRLGMSSFDRYAVLLIEDGKQQRLVWQSNIDDIVREAYLPNGEMQKIAKEFCDVIRGDPTMAHVFAVKPETPKSGKKKSKPGNKPLRG